jgi:hypothetical protein
MTKLGLTIHQCNGAAQFAVRIATSEEGVPAAVFIAEHSIFPFQDRVLRRPVETTPESGQTGRGRGASALCQEATYAPQQKHPLFDHVISDREQRR